MPFGGSRARFVPAGLAPGAALRGTAAPARWSGRDFPGRWCGWLPRTVCGMDAASEPPGMGSRRVRAGHTHHRPHGATMRALPRGATRRQPTSGSARLPVAAGTRARAHATCSLTTGLACIGTPAQGPLDGRPAGRVAHRHGEVAQPARVPDAADRRALGAPEELGLVPREQRAQGGRIEAMARQEIRFRRRGGRSGSRGRPAGSRRSRRRGCRAAARKLGGIGPSSSIVR